MDSTPQHVYASNLLRRQSFGYPLRNPKPNDQFGLEGFRIGDLGYVDSYGEFNLVFNISSPPKELQDQILDFRLAEPVAKPAFPAKKVFMAGVERNPVDGRPRYLLIAVTHRESYLTSLGPITNSLQPKQRGPYSYSQTAPS